MKMAVGVQHEYKHSKRKDKGVVFYATIPFVID